MNIIVSLLHAAFLFIAALATLFVGWEIGAIIGDVQEKRGKILRTIIAFVLAVTTIVVLRDAGILVLQVFLGAN